MSLFWSSWISILSIACWLFILGVLVFNLKFKPKTQDDGTTGHEYDGIREYDKPLPKWWLVIFWLGLLAVIPCHHTTRMGGYHHSASRRSRSALVFT